MSPSPPGAEPEASPAGDAVVLSVIPRTSPQDKATEDLVERLRADVLPDAGLPVSLGGATAAFVDQSQATADRLRRCSSAGSWTSRSCCC
jgi:putative drug exporter of the RND superfamily